MYILGINTNHNSTAALLKDGEIIACASEERFTRVKNQSGIPKNAIDYCMKFAKISCSQIDTVAASDILSAPLIYEPSQKISLTVLGLVTDFFLKINSLLNIEDKITSRFPQIRLLFLYLINLPVRFLRAKSQAERLVKLQKILQLPKEKFTFLDHHTCHGFSALFSSNYVSKYKKILIFTCDGAGDLNCAVVAKYQNNEYAILQKIDSQQSLGFFYLHITQFLGMKPIEDEYKVMGLAPYATDQMKINLISDKLFRFFKFDKNKNCWEIKFNEHLIPHKLSKVLSGHRFDYIAAATQKVLEELVTLWIKYNIQKYRTNVIVCGGGVFANVKLNQKIAELKNIKAVFFMSSPGDESNAIGAAFYAYWQKCARSRGFTEIKPLKSLYLGPEYTDKEIVKAMAKSMLKNRQYSISKKNNINKIIPHLLAKGEIIARFSGRMEFGARALGNRSILADPSRLETVEIINKAIKKRDFWMPFAPVILKEREKDYLISDNLSSPFMTLTFKTTIKGRKDLAAAIHPYDKTTRAQILDHNINPNFWELIKEFENITGISALLNTSFNLHGEPIVMSPSDAIRVFKLSGLKYLAIEDWLITKNE